MRESIRRIGWAAAPARSIGLTAVAVALAALALAPAVAAADELELTSGRKYYGKLIEKTPRYVTFRVIMGSATAELKFPAANVRAVRPGVDPPSKDPDTAPPDTGRTTRPAPKLRPAGEPSGLTWTAANTCTREQVAAIVQRDGKTPPPWWESVAPVHPASLDLTWGTPGEARSPASHLATYLAVTAYPKPDKWQATVKLLDEALAVNQADPAKLARTRLELAKAYQHLLGDWARAAYWYEQVEGDDADKLLGLAECYWKLGNKDMAAEILGRFLSDPTDDCETIQLWGRMGEKQIALEVAEGLAASRPAAAYLAAGNVCRREGEWDEALAFYSKAAAANPGGSRAARRRARARANAVAVKFFRDLEADKLPNGAHTGAAPGRRGPLQVRVEVESGQIGVPTVTRHKETMFLTALTGVGEQIAANQGPRGVDSVTNAGATSDAVINATARALAVAVAKAKPKSNLRDGAFRGSAFGYKSNIVVEVVIKDGRIESCRVIQQKETPGYYKRVTHIPAEIVRRQGVGGMHTVSRATKSSRAILKAANQALARARRR